MTTIITAATHELFKPFLDYSFPRAKRFGYKIYFIDLLTYGEGTKYDLADMGIHSITEPWMVHVRAQKIEWILKAWEDTSGNRVWMDADAVVLRPFDEVWDDDFDIAFTMSKAAIKAGVFFMRDTPATKHFLQLWTSLVKTPDQLRKKTGYGALTDQHMLNKILAPFRPFNVGDSFMVEGAHIKLVNEKIYNWSPFGLPLSTEAKILHLDGTKKKKRWEMIKNDLPK